MIRTKQHIIELYRKRARRYDITANLYYLLGFREWTYRKRTIQALKLDPGNTVVEMGCGTGLNFSLLQRAVGPDAKIIGLDLTDRMLEQAKRRVEKHGWSNVELVLADASEYQFPVNLDGILSTFAITLIPDYDSIIQKASMALSHGKRISILDFKLPSGQPLWMVNIAVLLTRLFGVSLNLANRRPWKSIERYFDYSWFKEIYMGFTYIAVGETGKQFTGSPEQVNLAGAKKIT